MKTFGVEFSLELLSDIAVHLKQTRVAQLRRFFVDHSIFFKRVFEES